MPRNAAPLERHFASWPRRIVAIFLDWIVCTLVAIAIIGPARYAGRSDSGWVVLAVFAVEVTLLTAFAGGSFGQLVVGIRVLTLEGRPLNLLVALARTLFICLVVPPLIFRSADGRGLHDLWTGSAAYHRQVARTS